MGDGIDHGIADGGAIALHVVRRGAKPGFVMEGHPAGFSVLGEVGDDGGEAGRVDPRFTEFSNGCEQHASMEACCRRLDKAACQQDGQSGDRVYILREGMWRHSHEPARGWDQP